MKTSMQRQQNQIVLEDNRATMHISMVTQDFVCAVQFFYGYSDYNFVFVAFRVGYSANNWKNWTSAGQQNDESRWVCFGFGN